MPQRPGRIHAASTLIFLFLAQILAGQDDPCRYVRPVKITPSDTVAKSDTSKSKPWKYTCKQLISFATLYQSRSENKSPGGKFTLSGKSDFKARYQKGIHALEFNLFDDSGFTIFPDSLIETTADQSQFKCSYQKEQGKKGQSSSASVQLSTQKLNAYATDSPEKRLKSSFLSPAEILLALGFTQDLQKKGQIELGLAGVKISWLNNKNLYNIHETNILHGIEQNRSCKVEGGLSFQSRYNTKIGKHITWENRSQVFSPLHPPHIPNIEVRNDFQIQTGKLLVTSIRSVYSYKTERWPPAALVGELALGLNLQKR